MLENDTNTLHYSTYCILVAIFLTIQQ